MSETEYLCLTLLGEPEESRESFQSRLTAWWSYLLRQRPELYEQVYAEAVEFTQHQGRLARQYMVAVEAADAVVEEAIRFGLASVPLERDDLYSRYEASGPEWFQIEH